MLIYYCLLFYANITSLIVIKSTERNSIVMFSKIKIHTHESFVQLDLNWIDPIFLLQLEPANENCGSRRKKNKNLQDHLKEMEV